MIKNNNPIDINPKWWLLAICILSLFVYSSSFQGEILHFDDNQYFEDYPEITHLSWENVARYFSEHYVIMYHPLPILTFALQFKISGLSPAPFHYFNFFFHLINILLVFKLCQKLLQNNIGGLIVALIFAIHPMNTEAVSWISARSSVMYTCFFLTSILCYIRYFSVSEKPQMKWYILSIFFALLSFFSKANALPLPIVLLAFDWFYQRKPTAKMLAEKLPFFIMSLLFGLKALNDSGTANNLSLGSHHFNLVEAILLSTYSIWHYIIHFFIPYHLSAIHSYPTKVNDFLPLMYYLSPIFLFVLAWFLFKNRNNRILVFGTIFFILVVSVTLQIIPSRLFLLADRYVYLPYIGFGLILASYTINAMNQNNLKMKKWGNYALFAIIIWAFALSIISYNRNKIWNNTIALVSDIIEKNNYNPYMARAYGIRALMKEQKGNSQGALVDYNKAIELRNTDGETYYNRARLYFANRQFEMAQTDFLKAKELLGTHFTLLNYLGGCAFNLGNYEKAIKYYSQALEENPNFAEAWRNKGSSNAMLKNYEQAEQDYSKAIAIQSADAENYRMRGILYLKLNNAEKACNDLSRAKQLGAKSVDNLLKQNNCNN